MHIFISYSKQDIEFARHLRKLLENEGFTIWVDETQLIPSQKWWATIEENIITCSAFIVIMSHASANSDWVEREILLAEQKEKECGYRLIFPVLLSGKTSSRLAERQYADMTTGVLAKLPERLIEGLRSLIPYHNHMPPPQPSLLLQDKANSTSLGEIQERITDSIYTEDKNTLILHESDLSTLFISATEMEDHDPLQSVIIYDHIIKTDPDYLNGTIDRAKQQLIPKIVEKMVTNAQYAFTNGEWKNATKFAQDALQFDKNAFSAKQIIEKSEANTKYEPIYKEAALAVQKGKWKAVSKLLNDIRKGCLDYGDPSHLLPITSELIEILDLKNHFSLPFPPSIARQRANSISFSSEGRFFAAGFENDYFAIWDMPSGKHLYSDTTLEGKRISGGSSPVRNVAFSADSKIFASLSLVKDIQLWSIAEMQPTVKLLGDTGAICAFAISPDGTRIASGSVEGLIRLWRLPDGAPTMQMINHYRANLWTLKFSPKGDFVAASFADREIKLWNLKTNEIKTLIAPENDPCHPIEFSPSGDHLVAGSRDGVIHIWDISTGNLISSKHLHRSVVVCFTFSPDGEILISGSNDRTMKLWNFPDMSLIVEKDLLNPVHKLAFYPNGTIFASFCETDNKIDIWGIG